VLLLQFKLGNFVKEIGLLSYYDRGPSYGLIFGLVFGLSIPIIIICVALYILCIWRKKQNDKHSPQRAISIMQRNRPENTSNSYTGAETIPLQTRNNADNTIVREEEVAKGDCMIFFGN
jgi:hypothetical protein